jgi:hypothetical protein
MFFSVLSPLLRCSVAPLFTVASATFVLHRNESIPESPGYSISARLTTACR